MSAGALPDAEAQQAVPDDVIEVRLVAVLLQPVALHYNLLQLLLCGVRIRRPPVVVVRPAGKKRSEVLGLRKLRTYELGVDGQVSLRKLPSCATLSSF